MKNASANFPNAPKIPPITFLAPVANTLVIFLNKGFSDPFSLVSLASFASLFFLSNASFAFLSFSSFLNFSSLLISASLSAICLDTADFIEVTIASELTAMLLSVDPSELIPATTEDIPVVILCSTSPNLTAAVIGVYFLTAPVDPLNDIVL